LGSTAANTWLKVPVVDDMARVMASSTLPSLVLGGEVPQDPDHTYGTWADALALPNVHGLVVGRALLYPSDGDYEAAIDTAVSLL
ncbi:MAG: deoxyribose-phosphate aldolase, partial [Dermatophilaceae bacterium]|nr:deoxyribose-phosphate aldolase [Dermatophilaceae bacterium]